MVRRERGKGWLGGREGGRRKMVSRERGDEGERMEGMLGEVSGRIE